MTKLERLKQKASDTEAVAAAAYSNAYATAYTDYYACYGDSVYAEAEAKAHADAHSGTAYDDCFKAKQDLANYLKEQH